MSLRDTLRALADALADKLEPTEDARYYDQDSSPFPADMHCRLVRTGELPGFKSHGRVFVERADMHRFIEAHRVVPTPGARRGTTEDQAVADILKNCPVKRGSHAA